MANKDVRVVDVDEALARKIWIVRPDDEIKGGFQRELSKKRIPQMVRDLTGDVICPAIDVADIKGTLYLVDGQHRLEAWRIKHFPLKAQVHKMGSMEEAAISFIGINNNAKRARLAHRLRVDPGAQAKAIRELASEFGLQPSVVFRILWAINSHNLQNNATTREDFALARTVLESWADDKRWGKDSYYSKTGVLAVVAQVVKRSKHPKSALAELKNMDFSRSGPFATRYGTGGSALVSMRNLIHKHIAEKVL